MHEWYISITEGWIVVHLKMFSLNPKTTTKIKKRTNKAVKKLKCKVKKKKNPQEGRKSRKGKQRS